MGENADSQPVDWIDLLTVLWSSRKFIVLMTGIATVVAVVVSLLLPEYYRSTTTLLPETEKSNLAGLGGLSDLAALAGVNVVSEGSLAKLYPTIIKSETVLRNVIFAEYRTKKFNGPTNLIRFWEISEATPERDYEAALISLSDALIVSLDNKTSVVSISIETQEPALSSDILKNITKELDSFIRTRRTTNAGEQRKWIEERLGEVKKDLEHSENDLKVFGEKNRRILDSPQLLLEQRRLMRRVEINSTLFVELKKQHEIAKIEEIKNVPIINVMDEARPAAKKNKPKRVVIVISSLIVSFVGVIGYVTLRHRYGGSIVEFANGVMPGQTA